MSAWAANARGTSHPIGSSMKYLPALLLLSACSINPDVHVHVQCIAVELGTGAIIECPDASSASSGGYPTPDDASVIVPEDWYVPVYESYYEGGYESGYWYYEGGYDAIDESTDAMPECSNPWLVPGLCDGSAEQ